VTIALLRFARASDDAAAIADIYAPYCTDASAVSFETEAPTPLQILERITRIQASLPWIVCEDANGALLGYAYASPHRERAAYMWCVEVGIYVAQEAQGRRVGRALYEALFELLTAQGYVNAYAGISVGNETSVRMHEALGFSLIGVYSGIGYKAGAWRDVAWYGRSLAARSEPPSPPVPLPQAVSPELAQSAFDRLAACVTLPRSR